MTITCKPKRARLYFRLREPVNWLFTAAIFTGVLIVLMCFIDPFLAGVFSIALAFCLFFFVFDKPTFGMECPHCKKYVEANGAWKCGSKGCRNDNVDDYPFI